MADTEELLKKSKSILKGQVTKFKNKVDDCNAENTSVILCQELLKTQDVRYQDIQDLRKRAFTVIKEEAGLQEFSDEVDAYEEVLFNLKVKILEIKLKLDKKEEKKEKKDDIPQVIQTNALLPQTKLPTFAGTNTAEWLEFKEQFQSMIASNNSLGNQEKCHYLKQAIRQGSAGSLITIGDTFESLWDALVQRYDNKRVIVNETINEILELKPMSKENSSELKMLLDAVMRCVRTLKSFDFDTMDLGELFLVSVVASKLDKNSRKQYELGIARKKDFPKWKDLKSFMEDHVRILENIETIQKHSDGDKKKNDQHKRPKSFIATNQGQSSGCVVCKSNHELANCEKFKAMSIKDRYLAVRNSGICMNCFAGSHVKKECPESGCTTCNNGEKHHQMLHFTKKQQEDGRKQDPIGDTSHVHSCIFLPAQDQEVVLSTAVVKVFDGHGNSQFCRVLLDNGSQCNFISGKLANSLKLRQIDVNKSIGGINGKVSTKIKKSVDVSIQSRLSEKSFLLNCNVVSRVTSYTPSNPIKVDKSKLPPSIQLADPYFEDPAEIDMLIGGEFFFDIVLNGKIEVDGLPLLKETVFGWIATGKVNNNSISTNHFSCNLSSLEEINETMKKFWEIESEGTSAKSEKNCEELLAEKHFCDTHYRDETGKYFVRLPLACEEAEIGSSFDLAQRSLSNLRSRLKKQSEVHRLYKEFLLEYEKLGHMHEVQLDPEVLKSSYFMPHHGVYRPDSSSTKLRVVFNASAPSTSGKSLNDLFLNGGVIQDPLVAIMMRFRLYQHVFSVDICKMYRQIGVDPRDTHLQRILWKPDDENLKIYELNTVTYGTRPAPFLATRTLKQLALDYANEYPLASKIGLQDVYVDDVFTGSNDLEIAMKSQQELIKMFGNARMELHKWFSNNKDLLGAPESEDVEHVISIEENAVKTLGLSWFPASDVMGYRVKFSENSVCTKRSVLSEISRIFDPLGLISPVITTPKIQMQQLWKLHVKWNDVLPPDEIEKWKVFRKSMETIQELKVPRLIIPSQAGRLELHGFADASQLAFGAVIYLRSETHAGFVTQLVCSKSRVAPIKTQTIPKLELCACLLLANLMKTTDEMLKLEIDNWFYWTDSTIALCWINNQNSKFKVFVGNRVQQINDLCPDANWNHVRSEDNPADLISRGVPLKKLKDSKLWWHGPSFLEKDQPNWHQSSFDMEKLKTTQEVSCEMKTEDEFSHVTKIPSDTDGIPNFLLKYGSFKKLIHIYALVLRFIDKIKKNGNTVHTKTLTPCEIDNATTNLVQKVQEAVFANEMTQLSAEMELPKSSRIKNLSPFVKDGLLRVGGRLKQANLSLNQMHPMLLPAKHLITTLIFRHYHELHLHQGPQALLYAVRQKYWPINGKNLARQIVHNCVICFRTKPVVSQQIMGDLPKDCLTPCRPFLICGVDYAGPFLVRYKGQRSNVQNKVWVAVFVCFFSKAVHLEMVTDATSQTFIAALKRFFARRGRSRVIWSDNATTFIGARNELEELQKIFQNEAELNLIRSFCSDIGILWRHIPPRSPHFGGRWESNVKIFKQHLKKTLRNSIVNWEEFLTIITEVEGFMNTRPLTPMSSDPNDFQVLTPAHFLMTAGDPPSIDQPRLVRFKENRLTAWQKCTKFVHQQWDRWYLEVLNNMQQKTKWYIEKQNLKIGDMVLLVEDNLPPGLWPLGRIVEVFNGPDGRVRVVNIKTQKGIFKRAIAKVCVLPLESTEEN